MKENEKIKSDEMNGENDNMSERLNEENILYNDEERWDYDFICAIVGMCLGFAIFLLLYHFGVLDNIL